MVLRGPPPRNGATNVLFIPLFALLANLIKEITIPTGSISSPTLG